MTFICYKNYDWGTPSFFHLEQIWLKVGGKDNNNIRWTSWCCHSLNECAKTLIDVKYIHTMRMMNFGI